MIKFQIGPTCITKEEFASNLNYEGLEFGYIPDVYDKWEQDGITYYRTLLDGVVFLVMTDDESLFPEVIKTEDKTELYSFRWLEEFVHTARISGPAFYETFIQEMERYVAINRIKFFS